MTFTWKPKAALLIYLHFATYLLIHELDLHPYLRYLLTDASTPCYQDYRLQTQTLFRKS